MTTKYFALLTNIGAAKLANATALGAQVEITQMAVGDGNGALPTPNPAQTALVHELRRAQLNMLTVDPVNTNQIIAEQVIPEDAGGWWIREIGLFDKDGDMIAVANCAETYKPQLQEGSGRVQVIRVILIVSSTEAVTLKIDPSVVLATRKYVDDAVIEVKAYADDVMKKHVAAANPHKQYPLIANALKEMVDAGLVNQVLQNFGLGEAAKRDVGTTVGTVAAGDDLRITGALQKENNLYELTNKSDARANLGLGTVATKNVGNSAGQIPDMSYWSSPEGGINFPNGFQMRFGAIAGNGGKLFSTPFTNQCYGIVFGQTYASNFWIFSPMYRASDLSKTGFSFINRAWSGISGTEAQDAGESVFYIALGGY